MQPFFPKMSYFRKQLWVVIGVNFVSLAVAGSLLYTSFVDDYRDNLVEAMNSKVSMLSATSSSALLFNDDAAAQSILSSLSESPDTRFAQIVDQNKMPFADYLRAGQQVDIDLSQLTAGHFFINDNLYIFQPIRMDEETLGHIILSADTETLQQQQKRYARIVVIVFAFSLLLAYGLNWRSQHVMAAPINKLVELVAYVAQKRRYHKRLDVEQDDEIGTLVAGVNSMLDTIETHEKQLQENSERLESLVALRTEQLFQRANYDALTHLPNRHLLIDRLNHGIDNADRENSSMALMFLDLDRFKVINDSLGHTIGDLLLSQVAEKLSHLVRKADSVCRWGGDEFVILVEHMLQPEDIEHLARQIIQSLGEPMTISGHQLHISTSIGIARYPEDGRDSMTLLKHADISMYRAKDRGPGQYCFFDSSMLDDSVQRLSMESMLRKALENEAFHLVYQPEMCLRSGNLCGFEALIRWNNDGEFIPPSTFIPVAEEIGLINKLSEWVLKQACQQTAAWRAEGLNVVPVAVNLPAAFIVQPNCAQIIEDLLGACALPANYLEIEITENAFVESTEATVRTLEKLKNIGVGVAIDDFGTGYSCLSYLRDLPVSKLKIDGSFVKNLGDGGVNDGIVHSIVTLGKSLQLIVVGECVETEQHARLLDKLECDMVQGYLYSKPLLAQQTADFIRQFQS